MWNPTRYSYFILFINVFYSFKNVSSFIVNMTEFREVDSDFDLAKAIDNYKPEDFDPSNIKRVGMFEEYALRRGPKYPNYDYKLREMPLNRTSEENVKLVEAARAIIDTSGEKEREKLLRSIEERHNKELGIKGTKQNDNNDGDNKKPVAKKRVKRAGVGKFADAAKVDNLKMLRIYLTMFSNLWTTSYTGGTHPLHRDVPKTIVILFKHRIMQFFFPPVGEQKKT